jgi:hypothetical protein
MKGSGVRVIVVGVVLLLVMVIIGVYETLKVHQATEHPVVLGPTTTTVSVKSPTEQQLSQHQLLQPQPQSQSQSQSQPQPLPSSSLRSPLSLARKRIAYAITITKDGFFQDGAAVLVYSILKYSVHSAYDISFIAFVHPNVTKARDGLSRIGFHVIEVPIPINVSAIQFDFLREKINKNGCCGAAEMIKLSSYRFVPTLL